MKPAFNVSWRQANRNWFVVDEDSGEIHAKVLEAEGTWLANAFPSLCCQFWSEKDAKRRVEQELAGATDCTYRFVDARERR